MTSIERKHNTENLLRDLGIPYIDHLPTIGEEDDARIRKPQEIAIRILCLTYLCYATEVPESKVDVVDFLIKEKLWEKVTDTEKELFNKQELTDQDRINISWRSEAIWLLLWAIEKVDVLDLPLDEVKVSDIVDRLPELMSPVKEFVDSATIRPTSQLLDQSDLIYRLHWATRQEELHKSIKLELNSSIVVERHWAINWVTYDADNWDDITTDT